MIEYALPAVSGNFRRTVCGMASFSFVILLLFAVESRAQVKSCSFQTTGYGLAATYFIKNTQLKAFAERALLLPSKSELFEDETLNKAASNLPPESYTNVSLGADAEVRYYNNKVMVGGTVAYMDIRNKEKLRAANSAVSAGMNCDRIPNTPCIYGSADAAYFLNDLLGKGNIMILNYSSDFVSMFYLLWQSQGRINTKATLTQQLNQDLIATYPFKQGRNNISIEALNWVSGLPEQSTVTDAGWPLAGDGKVYIPLTTGTTNPTVNVVNPETATAIKGIEVESATSIGGLAKLKY